MASMGVSLRAHRTHSIHNRMQMFLVQTMGIVALALKMVVVEEEEEVISAMSTPFKTGGKELHGSLHIPMADSMDAGMAVVEITTGEEEEGITQLLLPS